MAVDSDLSDVEGVNFKMRFRQKLPLILQDQLSECGHACVVMIACFWGHELDLPCLRQQIPASLRGINLHEVTQIFEKIGFETRALSVPLSELHLVKCPALLHWNMNHFVVLKKVTSKSITIHDPAIGVCHFTHAQISQHFTGIVLEVEKSSSFQSLMVRAPLTLWSWMKSVRHLKRWLGVLIMLSVLIEFFNMACPLFTQYLIDRVIGTHNVQNLSVILLGFLLMIVCLVLSERFRSHLVLYLKMNMTEQFSVNIMRHLFHLPLQFFEARHKGDLQSKMNAISEIQRKISIDFVTTMLDGLMMVLQIGLMLVYSVPLSCLVLSALILQIMMRFLSYRVFKDKMNSAMYQHAKAASVFLESLQTVLPMKAYVKESLRLNAWRKPFTEALNQEMIIERYQIRYQLLNQLATQIEYLVVVAWGALMVMNQALSVGMLLAFLGFRQQLVQKATAVIHQIFEYRLVGVQLERLNDIVSHPPEEKGPEGRMKALIGHMAVEKISFTYHPSAPPILSDVSFSVEAGEKVVLVGPSGCGKTTLLKIMMGLLNPCSGRVCVDGFALNHIGVQAYRTQVASVMQEDVLFSGSLLENITFFDEYIDFDYVHEVSMLACIADFIQSLPMGYETRVGDMGSSLSGGQKQRLLLARALYKRPKILFLDEATSHLDANNEHELNRALRSLNMTQVMVAHRQETILMADRVIDLSTCSFDRRRRSASIGVS
jgi:ATP-binding cassette, subfamily B, bacterial CvaB/MchF/RaxB